MYPCVSYSCQESPVVAQCPKLSPRVPSCRSEWWMPYDDDQVWYPRLWRKETASRNASAQTGIRNTAHTATLTESSRVRREGAAEWGGGTAKKGVAESTTLANNPDNAQLWAATSSKRSVDVTALLHKGTGYALFLLAYAGGYRIASLMDDVSVYVHIIRGGVRWPARVGMLTQDWGISP